MPIHYFINLGLKSTFPSSKNSLNAGRHQNVKHIMVPDTFHHCNPSTNNVNGNIIPMGTDMRTPIKNKVSSIIFNACAP